MYEPLHRIPLFGQIVVGATKRVFPLWIDDESGAPVNLTGGSAAASLQGYSYDAVGSITQAGTIVDGPDGYVTFLPGSLVSQANLTSAGKKKATFVCRVRYVDVAGKIDYTNPFRLEFVQDPLQLP